MKRWILLKFHEAEEEGGKMKKNRRGYRRIVLMTKILEALEISPDESVCSTEEQSKADCMAIYFRSLPDPHIARDEFKEYLQFLSQGFLSKTGVTMVMKKFEEVYQPKDKYEPRSLAHACRLSIRNRLQRASDQTRSLPASVEKLVFPDKLKEYLLGEW